MVMFWRNVGLNIDLQLYVANLVIKIAFYSSFLFSIVWFLKINSDHTLNT